MAIPKTFLFYIGRTFFLHIMMVTSVVALLCFLGTLTESARRLSEYNAFSYETLFKMAFYQVPSLIEIAFPFIFLIGAISCFLTFTRRLELDAVRTNGISAWVFISPALIIALLSGLFLLTIYNPISAVLSTEFSELRAIYVKRKSGLLSLAESGIWLKQGGEKNHSIVHASSASPTGSHFKDVTIFLYQKGNTFVGRLDAQEASLEKGAWKLDSVWITNTNGESHFTPTHLQPTDLTPSHVYESVAPPQTISFWNLGEFIRLAKKTQLAVPTYEFHWYSLVTMPFFLVAMTLLGASATFFFSMRQGREVWLVSSCLFVGFGIYLLLFLGRKISADPETPIMLAAVAPIIVAFAVGFFLFLQKEEG